MANSAATGVLVLEYALGNQKCSGSIAAFKPNTASNNNAPDLVISCSLCDKCGILSAISAKFRVPKVPYKVPKANKNNDEPIKFGQDVSGTSSGGGVSGFEEETLDIVEDDNTAGQRIFLTKPVP